MSKYRKTLKSKYYWTARGQGEIYSLLKDQIKERGDAAKLAKKIGSTPGYVSQILSGDTEINPSWKKIVKLCLALDKVPILEIKDLDEFIFEERMKASLGNHEKMFHTSCQVLEKDKNEEVSEPIHMEINDFTFLNRTKGKRKVKVELYECKYELA